MNFLLEVKDGSKPPSKRKLTPDEVRFFDEWRGQATIVYSPEDAVRRINTMTAEDDGLPFGNIRKSEKA